MAFVPEIRIVLTKTLYHPSGLLRRVSRQIRQWESIKTWVGSEMKLWREFGLFVVLHFPKVLNLYFFQTTYRMSYCIEVFEKLQYESMSTLFSIADLFDRIWVRGRRDSKRSTFDLVYVVGSN